MAALGACQANPSVTLCLACGRIANETDRNNLFQHFRENGWLLWDENWLRDRLKIMASRGYENQVSAVVSKLLFRGRIE